MEDPTFDWVRNPNLEHSHCGYCADKSPDESIFLDVEGVYSSTEVTNIGEICVLSGTSDKRLERISFSVNSDPIKFSTYNCATHHICSGINLFVDKSSEVTNVGIKKVTSTAPSAWIGTIQFNLTDDEGIIGVMRLDDVYICQQQQIT